MLAKHQRIFREEKKKNGSNITKLAAEILVNKDIFVRHNQQTFPWTSWPFDFNSREPSVKQKSFEMIYQLQIWTYIIWMLSVNQYYWGKVKF